MVSDQSLHCLLMFLLWDVRHMLVGALLCYYDLYSYKT